MPRLNTEGLALDLELKFKGKKWLELNLDGWYSNVSLSNLNA